MLNKILKYFRQPMGIVAISFGLIPFMSPKQQPYVFDFARTINFFQPDTKWPYEKLFTPAEKQVYDQLGRPDCFRMLWNSTGEIKIRSIVEQEWSGKKLKQMPPFTWVYADRKEEVIFSKDGVHAQPLNELVLTVLKYGDPEVVKDLGNGLKQWTYYSTGKMYTIAGTHIVETKDFPAMGTWNR